MVISSRPARPAARATFAVTVQRLRVGQTVTRPDCRWNEKCVRPPQEVCS